MYPETEQGIERLQYGTKQKKFKLPWNIKNDNRVTVKFLEFL